MPKKRPWHAEFCRVNFARDPDTGDCQIPGLSAAGTLQQPVISGHGKDALRPIGGRNGRFTKPYRCFLSNNRYLAGKTVQSEAEMAPDSLTHSKGPGKSQPEFSTNNFFKRSPKTPFLSFCPCFSTVPEKSALQSLLLAYISEPILSRIWANGAKRSGIPKIRENNSPLFANNSGK